MQKNVDSVGIASTGYYIPKDFLSSEEIAQRAGIPVHVLTEKIGMQKKPVASPSEQPSSMALAAARAAVREAHIDPNDIDIIIYSGSAPQDYLLWSAAGKLQHSLGAKKAFAFEITNGCNGINLGMHVAKNMLLGNDSHHLALVVSADKYSPFMDFTKKDDVSLFHVADAAGAAILRKNEPTNRIISYYQITDGAYADHIKIKTGGTAHPYSSQLIGDRQTFSVENPEELVNLLTKTYRANYVSAIRTALELCGHTPEDVDFLFTNQVKASTISEVLESLQVPPSKTFRSIVDYGHMGTVDTLYALSRSLADKNIKPGNLVVLASSAIGFSWAALVLQY
jgi:3-oxoacyl-[acyl-carrier-protein] synthase III